MANLFVTRHPGAREWAEQQGIAVERFIKHLEPNAVKAGDVVIGSLPMNLVAQVCAKGARYLHLSLDLPIEARGRELTAEEMCCYGAHVEEYWAERIER